MPSDDATPLFFTDNDLLLVFLEGVLVDEKLPPESFPVSAIELLLASFRLTAGKYSLDVESEIVSHYCTMIGLKRDLR